MSKIPFDIKYRSQIESGEYKVVTENDEPARIICWDSTINKERPIIAIVFNDQIEQYKADGRYDNDYDTSNYDLFIITPDPELSEFEQQIENLLNLALPEGHAGTTIKNTKRVAAELLELAKKELCESGEVTDWYAKGRKEALKDLPRWIDDGMPEGSAAIDIGGLYGFDFIRRHGRLLRISDLEKLPGFNEGK